MSKSKPAALSSDLIAKKGEAAVSGVTPIPSAQSEPMPPAAVLETATPTPEAPSVTGNNDSNQFEPEQSATTLPAQSPITPAKAKRVSVMATYVVSATVKLNQETADQLDKALFEVNRGRRGNKLTRQDVFVEGLKMWLQSNESKR